MSDTNGPNNTSKDINAIRAHDRHHAMIDMLNQAAVDSSEKFLKTCVIVNGGAAISILAFVGGIASKEKELMQKLLPIANSLSIFAYGVLAAAMGYGFAYLTHYFAGRNLSKSILTWQHPYSKSTTGSNVAGFLSMFCHCVAALATIASIGCFIIGALSVRDGIQAFGS